MPPPLPCLVVGTGEYTTGYGLNSSKTDKAAGVVLLTLFEMRRQGVVGAIHLAGVNGGKFPAIRAHMARAIGEAYPGSAFDLSCTTYPADGAVDPLAYRAALAALPRGSGVLIFPPDDTHFPIALDAIRAGMHVLVTKPITLTLAHQAELVAAAKEAGVLCAGEFHKRWDPIYSDARDRLRKLGDLSFYTCVAPFCARASVWWVFILPFFSRARHQTPRAPPPPPPPRRSAYMSQPKLQLDTFSAWAGKSSDISYYLNSHHVDYCEWVTQGRGRPLRVTAAAATGVAAARLGRPCEDTISLTAHWENLPSRNIAVATFVSSWVAPPADVHSQQRFFAMMHQGEATVDQCHRGFSTSTEAAGYASPNPLFMRYTPDDAGRFAGQGAYGFRSIEAFLRAAAAGDASGAGLATAAHTLQGAAVLEAGRRSLDAGGRAVRVLYADADSQTPIGLELEAY